MESGNSLKAILFADIAGSTTLYESAGDASAHQSVTACLETLGGICVRNHGEIIKSIGDEILCSFEEPDRALVAASEMQISVREQGILQVRIGFHFGPVVEADDDVFGDTVNLAARVVALCNPGQILTTRETRDTLTPFLGKSCRRLHSTHVKGRSGKVTLYEVVWNSDDGLTIITDDRTFYPAANQLTLYFRSTSWCLTEKSNLTKMGRGAGNGIVVDIPTASRFHATIAFYKGKYVLKDISSNGTFVQMLTGEQYVLHREELILTGSGEIGLGCSVSDLAEDVVKFAVTT
jgi:adenylate cyclase